MPGSPAAASRTLPPTGTRRAGSAHPPPSFSPPPPEPSDRGEGVAVGGGGRGAGRAQYRGCVCVCEHPPPVQSPPPHREGRGGVPRFVLVGPSRRAGAAPPPPPSACSPPIEGGDAGVRGSALSRGSSLPAPLPGAPKSRRSRASGSSPGRWQAGQKRGPLPTWGGQILGRPPPPNSGGGGQRPQDMHLASLTALGVTWASPGVHRTTTGHRHGREGTPGEKPSGLRDGSSSLAFLRRVVAYQRPAGFCRVPGNLY